MRCLSAKYFGYCAIYFLLITGIWVGLCSVTQAQQLDSLHGAVIDEEGIGIVGVSMNVNGKPAIYTDKKGLFAGGPLGGDGKIHQVIAKKEGYRMASWGIPNKKDGIEVVMRRLGGVRGDVLDKASHPVSRVSVVVESPFSFGPVYTDEDGHFVMDIPTSAKLNQSVRFIVDGKPVDAAAMSFSDEFRKVVIRYTPAPKHHSSIYTICLVNEAGKGIEYGAVAIEGKMYVADAYGCLKLSWKGNIDQMPIEVEDYLLIGGQPLDANNQKSFIFKKKALEHSTGASKDPLSTQPISATEGLENMILDKYGEDFNKIFSDLRLERRQLAYKSDSIRQEVKRVVGQLANEAVLSEHERHTLTQYLIRLEEELIASNDALRQVQARTEENFLHMRDALQQKDSINEAANETIHQIEAEKEEISEELRRDLLIFGVVILSLLLVSFFFFFFAKNARKKNKEVATANAQLKRTQTQLQDTLSEVNALNASVTLQHLKITNSIRYAQTIQHAILPTKAMMDSYFGEYFIIYRPKEIVSGDFYWAAQVDDRQKTFIAAIDCTGHGVPGGFMSMIGHSLLNDLIYQKHVYDPSEILEQLNMGIRGALKQDEKINEDGMDVCLCILEKQANGATKVTFSGAMRPLYYFSEGQVNQLKGALKSAGGLQRRAGRLFENQEIVLKAGDVLYLSSDGMADQHNRGNYKLGTRKLVEILKENAKLPLSEQQINIEEEFDHFKDGVEQRDDVMLIGIYIS